MSKDKKTLQLGMNPSTASGRLIKDTLWRLIVESGQDSCYQCGEKMTRDNFSVEHKEPWLDSEDPVGLFFDQSNISFSHHACNVKMARKPHRKYDTREEYYQANLKMDADRRRLKYTPESRSERYKRTGH